MSVAAARLHAIGRPSPARAKLRGELSPQQPEWFTRVVAATLHADRGLVKVVAYALQIPVRVVYAVADRYDPRALKAWWIPTICRETGSFAILDCLEREVGRVAFVLPVATNDDHREVIDHVTTVTREFSDVLASVSESIADATITTDECERVEQQIDEMQAALAALKARVKAARRR